MFGLTPKVTEALEDYLETIYLLVQEHKVARVKEIARAREVRMSSVSTAMKRLSEMGLVRYAQREFIELTPEGEEKARRILARHEVLRRLFRDLLDLDPARAEEDACSMEHHLSPEGMDRLTRLFEFLDTCPQVKDSFIERFKTCRTVNPESGRCDDPCRLPPHRHRHGPGCRRLGGPTLADLKPGEVGVISQVIASGPIRQRLLDMGFLPHTEVGMERFAPSGDPVWVRLKGFQLSLRLQEARSVLLQAP